MFRLDIDTTDPELLRNLQEANLEGIHVSRRMEASALDIDTLETVVLISVQIIKLAAVPMLIQWLYDRIKKAATHKTSINKTDVSDNPAQIRVLIELEIQRYKGDIADEQQP